MKALIGAGALALLEFAGLYTYAAFTDGLTPLFGDDRISAPMCAVIAVLTFQMFIWTVVRLARGDE